MRITLTTMSIGASGQKTWWIDIPEVDGLRILVSNDGQVAFSNHGEHMVSYQDATETELIVEGDVCHQVAKGVEIEAECEVIPMRHNTMGLEGTLREWDPDEGDR